MSPEEKRKRYDKAFELAGYALQRINMAFHGAENKIMNLKIAQDHLNKAFLVLGDLSQYEGSGVEDLSKLPCQIPAKILSFNQETP